MTRKLIGGLLAGSQMIVFDGLYSFASVGLSVLAVMALRFARRGADERFPWGREAAEPGPRGLGRVHSVVLV